MALLCICLGVCAKDRRIEKGIVLIYSLEGERTLIEVVQPSRAVFVSAA